MNSCNRLFKKRIHQCNDKILEGKSITSKKDGACAIFPSVANSLIRSESFICRYNVLIPGYLRCKRAA